MRDAKGYEKLYEDLPGSPGVYIMRGRKGEVLYVGKAGNLKRRVSSYFTRFSHGSPGRDGRIDRLVSRIDRIDIKRTDSTLEALILEAKLIKRHRPPYNVKEKDDKSFLYFEITDEPFPRLVLSRARELGSGKDGRRQFGPFTSASSARAAFKILRRLFPFNAHPAGRVGTYKRPCLDYEIGICPGTCVGKIDRKEYGKTVRNLRMFLRGEKERVIGTLEKEMEQASGALEYEKAEAVRKRIFALRHIRDTSLISLNGDVPEEGSERMRIEGFDISNISGTSAVGSMVVFMDGNPLKEEYKRFRIRTVKGTDDTRMLKEVLERRFGNHGQDWPLPGCVLVDGGIGQVGVARNVLDECGFHIPVVGMAKGPERKRTDIIGSIPPGVKKETLVRVRDEAHRFAIQYHRKVRRISSLS